MVFLAETSGGIGSLFTALGLNLQSLVLNTLAFLVIVWVLGKFVYPSLIKALDAKKDEEDSEVNRTDNRTIRKPVRKLIAVSHSPFRMLLHFENHSGCPLLGPRLLRQVAVGART